MPVMFKAEIREFALNGKIMKLQAIFLKILNADEKCLRDSQIYALRVGAKFGQTAIVVYLLSLGIKPNEVEASNEPSALFLAKREQRNEIVEILTGWQSLPFSNIEEPPAKIELANNAASTNYDPAASYTPHYNQTKHVAAEEINLSKKLHEEATETENNNLILNKWW